MQGSLVLRRLPAGLNASVTPSADASFHHGSPMSKPSPDFWKNVRIVLAGATGAQALPILIAPLLTRLCTPADMGAFSVWLGVVAVTSSAATLRLEAAMVIDQDRQQQRLCFGVVAYCATALVLVLTLAMTAARALGLPGIRLMSWPALLTVGAGAWLTAIMQTTLAYAASHKLFGQAAKAKMLQAGTIVASQLLLLCAGFDGFALLAGQLIGLGAGLWGARRLLSPPTARPGLVLDSEQRRYLVKHGAFWRFSLPSSLLNTVVGQLPLFMVGIHYGAVAAGLFALTQRVISAPVALIAVSVQEVFKREAAQAFQAVGNCRDAYRAAFRALLLLALGPALVLLLAAPQLFGWVFGEDWRPAGELARILAPMSFLNFIASPLSYVFAVAGKQKIELLWQVVLFLMTVTVFTVPLTLHQCLLAYAAGRSVLYLVYLYMSHRYAQQGRVAGTATAGKNGPGQAGNPR